MRESNQRTTDLWNKKHLEEMEQYIEYCSTVCTSVSEDRYRYNTPGCTYLSLEAESIMPELTDARKICKRVSKKKLHMQTEEFPVNIISEVLDLVGTRSIQILHGSSI